MIVSPASPLHLHAVPIESTLIIRFARWAVASRTRRAPRPPARRVTATFARREDGHRRRIGRHRLPSRRLRVPGHGCSSGCSARRRALRLPQAPSSGLRRANRRAVRRYAEQHCLRQAPVADLAEQGAGRESNLARRHARSSRTASARSTATAHAVADRKVARGRQRHTHEARA